MVALAEAGGADVTQCRASDGNTLLHVAAEKGNAEMVSTLMACNASLTMKNKKDQLPIDVGANDEIKQLINDEMAARFDHGLKRAVIPPPPPDEETEAAVAEVEQDIQQDNGEGVLNATTTATDSYVASEDEESEDSSSDDEENAVEKKKKMSKK